MKPIFSFLIMSLLCSSAFAQSRGLETASSSKADPKTAIQNKPKFTKQAVDLRSGPGSFYDMLGRVNAHTVVREVKTEDGWAEVNAGELKGWVPTYVLIDNLPEAKNKSDRATSLFTQLSENMGKSSETSAYATPAQVAAAVKGFAKRYQTKRRKDPTKVELESNFERRINASEYNRFRRQRIGDDQWEYRMRRFRLRSDTLAAVNPTLDEAGYAIAVEIAQKGLVRNYEVQRYVNNVAFLVGESSHRYEAPVQVHILDSNEISGYAVPGGYIFISKGALKNMRNEAELAFFLGHEIAHIVLNHGQKESESRRSRIRASELQSELERDLDYANRQDEDDVRVSQELTELADDIFEFLVKDRYEAYEFEADFWGMVYAYRAGYDHMSGVEYLSRLATQSQGKVQGLMEWNQLSTKKRVDAYNEAARRMRFKRDGKTMDKEFQSMMNRL